MTDDQNNHDEQPGADVEHAALAHPDVQAGLAEAKAGKTLKRQKPAAVADGDQGDTRTRRQLKLSPESLVLLDRFAELNRWKIGPAMQDVLDKASEVANKHIANLYEQTTSKLPKLDS